MKLWQPTRAKNVKLLVYGNPGSGKTHLVASACDDERAKPVFCINSGGNPESLLSSRILPNKEIPYIWELDKVENLNDLYEYFKAGQPEESKVAEFLFSDSKEEYRKFKTIAFDGITELQRFIIDGIKGVDYNEIDFTVFDRKQNYAAWGQTLARVTMITRLFYELPLHVIFTALEQDDKDSSTGAIKTTPLIWGQARKEVPGYALLTTRLIYKSQLSELRMTSKETELLKAEGSFEVVAKFTPSENDICKDQYGGLPPLMPSPTMTKILNAIYGIHK